MVGTSSDTSEGRFIVGLLFEILGDWESSIAMGEIMSAPIADWLIAIGTVILAVVALFQDTIRTCFYRPKFTVTVRCAPPDCVMVPFISQKTGQIVTNAIYLRLWIENIGNATARNVEVYASQLIYRRADGAWEPVQSFPPMNLKWANQGQIYFSSIAPGMGKHCDLGHIVDPVNRSTVGEEKKALGLSDQKVSLAFDLMVAPNHLGHIIGPGTYKLEILVAAENALPLSRTIQISLLGPWYHDESRMLRDGVGLEIV